MQKPKTSLKFATTQSELGQAFSVTERTITRWLKLPGNPGRSKNGFDIGAWRKFIDSQALRPAMSQTELLVLRRRKLTAECNRLELETAIRRGEFVPKALAESAIMEIANNGTAILRQKLEVELPCELVGLDMDRIRLKMVSVVDAIRAQMAGVLRDWTDISETSTKENHENKTHQQ